MPTIARTHATLALVLALACAGAAAADEKQDAKAHFENGLSMMELEDFEGAAVEFEASVAKYPTKNAMFNLAMCYKAQHRYALALETFRTVLTQFGGSMDQEMSSEVRKNIAAINRLIGEVIVTTNLPGATVLVDGELVGSSPLPRPLALGAGEHQIRVSLHGYQDSEQTVTVVSGTEARVDFNLQPAAAATVPAAGGAGVTPVAARLPAPPPNASAPPPPPPGAEGAGARDGRVMAGPPKEISRIFKLGGIGIGVQGIAMVLALATYYPTGSTMDLEGVGAIYYSSTAVVGGLVTWLYGWGSDHYDVAFWPTLVGAVAGAAVGYGASWLIWNYSANGRLTGDAENLSAETGAIMGVGILALLLPPVGEGAFYGIFREPEKRYQQQAAPTPPPGAPPPGYGPPPGGQPGYGQPPAGQPGYGQPPAAQPAPAAPPTAPPPAAGLELMPPLPTVLVDGRGNAAPGLMIGGAF